VGVGVVDSGGAVIEVVGAEAVRPLRLAVLLPGRPPADAVYRGDDAPTTVHVAARVGAGDGTGEVVAVGSAMVEDPPWPRGGERAWRVRGMAARPDVRDRGLGGQVLGALLDALAERGGALVWCNARAPARRLYERAGFAARGEVFDVPGIGPHVTMWRTVLTVSAPEPDPGPAAGAHGG